MPLLTSRLLFASVVAVTASGCGYGSFGYHAHHGRHGGSDVAFLATGLVVGAAIGSLAASSAREQPSGPVYVNNTYYADGSQPPSPPRSRWDDVKDDSLPSFDPQAARATFNEVDVSSCRATGASSGYGHAKVTINPDGRVSKVVVDEPAGLSADAVQCIGERIGAATVAPFKGSLVTMGMSFRLP